jgi:hypothetical protein
VVDEVGLEQIFSEYFGFPCQLAFHRLLHNHHHHHSLSSEVCTLGPNNDRSTKWTESLHVRRKKTVVTYLKDINPPFSWRIVSLNNGSTLSKNKIITLKRTKSVKYCIGCVKEQLVHPRIYCNHGTVKQDDTEPRFDPVVTVFRQTLAKLFVLSVAMLMRSLWTWLLAVISVTNQMLPCSTHSAFVRFEVLTVTIKIVTS